MNPVKKTETLLTGKKAHDKVKRGAQLLNSFSNLLPLLFLIVVFMPLMVLILDLGIQATGGLVNWQSWLESFYRRWVLLRNSINLAAGTAAAAMFIGLLAALRLWPINRKPWLYLRWLVLMFAVISPYMHALAWNTLFLMFRAILLPLGVELTPLGGWSGSWLVQTMAFLPLAVGLALLGLETVDPLLIEAGRMQHPDGKVTLKIALPLAAPAILAGFGFIFIFSLLDYSIPSLFGKNIYALEIFAEHSASGRAASAFLVALPLLLLSIVMVYFSQAPLREALVRPPFKVRPWNISPQWPVYLSILQKVALIILALHILVPLVGLSAATGSLSALGESVKLGRREIIFSLNVAVSTAIVAVPLAYPVASVLLNTKMRKGYWWILTALPLAVPAPLIGIGLILAWNRPLFGAIYGSAVMPILAALARFTPFAVIILLAQLKRIDPLLIEAAKILKRSKLSMLFKIHLPMLAPGMIAAFFFTFALTLGELGATLIVAPPGKATLTMRLYNLLHYGSTDLVAGLCLIIVFITALSASFVFVFLIIRESSRNQNNVRKF